MLTFDIRKKTLLKLGFSKGKAEIFADVDLFDEVLSAEEENDTLRFFKYEFINLNFCNHFIATFIETQNPEWIDSITNKLFQLQNDVSKLISKFQNDPKLAQLCLDSLTAIFNKEYKATNNTSMPENFCSLLQMLSESIVHDPNISNLKRTFIQQQTLKEVESIIQNLPNDVAMLINKNTLAKNHIESLSTIVLNMKSSIHLQFDLKKDISEICMQLCLVKKYKLNQDDALIKLWRMIQTDIGNISKIGLTYFSNDNNVTFRSKCWKQSYMKKNPQSTSLQLSAVEYTELGEILIPAVIGLTVRAFCEEDISKDATTLYNQIKAKFDNAYADQISFGSLASFQFN